VRFYLGHKLLGGFYGAVGVGRYGKRAPAPKGKATLGTWFRRGFWAGLIIGILAILAGLLYLVSRGRP
jgi:hypothetical protein